MQKKKKKKFNWLGEGGVALESLRSIISYSTHHSNSFYLLFPLAFGLTTVQKYSSG